MTMSIIDETQHWRTLDADHTANGAIHVKPCVSIRATYREIGVGVEDLELSWDAGTYLPGTADLVRIIDALRRPADRDDR
jgi:hypothetical protein